MSDRLLGELAARHDLGEATTLEEAVRAHLGPAAGAHDIGAIERDYLLALNTLLDPAGLHIEDDQVCADGGSTTTWTRCSATRSSASAWRTSPRSMGTDPDAPFQNVEWIWRWCCAR